MAEEPKTETPPAPAPREPPVPVAKRIGWADNLWYQKVIGWVHGFRKDYRVQIEHTFIDAHKFDSTDETHTSPGFYCGPYKEAVMCVKFTETGQATDFYIEVYFSEDGSDWYKYMNDYFGDWRYEDAAGDKEECVKLDILAPYIKVKIVSSGGTSSNYFIVSVKALFNS